MSPTRRGSGLRVTVSSLLSASFAAVLACIGCSDSSAPSAPRNRAPTFVAQRDTTAAVADTLRLVARATDPDGDDVHYTLVIVVTFEELQDGYIPAASLNGESGHFVFVPGTRDLPEREFQFLATDGRGGETAEPFTVSVSPARPAVRRPDDDTPTVRR